MLALRPAAVIERCLQESVATGRPAVSSFEMRYYTGGDRRGPPVWLASRFMFDGPHWYAVWRDVSEAKKAERSMHDWLATTSHDARTPLSSIKASCALLAEQSLCAEARELAAAVHGGASVMLSIVNHVMLLKRLDAGDANVAAGLAPVAVRDLARDVAAIARVGLAQQVGVSIALELDEQLPEALTCHREYLHHVLLSLLVYCVQTSGGADGGRTVRVRVGCEQQQQQHCLRLCVTAEARVLSPEQAAALFDPYTACGLDERHDAGGGSGRLGLLVARRLAAAMGGSLASHSCAEVGTRFVATIPAPAPNAAAHACAPSTAEVARRLARCCCCDDGDVIPSPREEAQALLKKSPGRTTDGAAVAVELPADRGILDILEDCGVGDASAADRRHERYEEKKKRGELRHMLDMVRCCCSSLWQQHRSSRIHARAAA